MVVNLKLLLFLCSQTHMVHCGSETTGQYDDLAVRLLFVTWIFMVYSAPI